MSCKLCDDPDTIWLHYCEPEPEQEDQTTMSDEDINQWLGEALESQVESHEDWVS